MLHCLAAYYRFVVLFFNCLLTFGSYFCFDIPSVLQDQFQGVSKRQRCLQIASILHDLIISRERLMLFLMFDRTWRVPMRRWSMGQWTVWRDWGWPLSSTIFSMPSMLGRKHVNALISLWKCRKVAYQWEASLCYQQECSSGDPGWIPDWQIRKSL